MDSYPYSDGHVRHVPHMEGSYGAEDVQRHVGDLGGVLVAVPLWKTRRHHVGVTDCLHLDIFHTVTSVCLSSHSVESRSYLDTSQ